MGLREKKGFTSLCFCYVHSQVRNSRVLNAFQKLITAESCKTGKSYALCLERADSCRLQSHDITSRAVPICVIMSQSTSGSHGNGSV